MNEVNFKIISNHLLVPGVYRMELEGDTSAIKEPGQFVEIALPGLYLRRPISVCDSSTGRLTLIYKTVGVGTSEMASLGEGDTLNLLCGLGHGFSVNEAVRQPVLVGGGVGVPPLLLLAKAWLSAGVSPMVALGFNTHSEIFLADEFRALGLTVAVATVDGSEGKKGFVTEAVKSLPVVPDFVQACGPLPMLRAISETFPDIKGEFSLEERMGCGFGACMGCTIHTADGPAQVCTEGPVFANNKIDWQLL